jgi:hypothetical protein
MPLEGIPAAGVERQDAARALNIRVTCPSVVLIDSCGMPWIVASSAAAKLPSTTSSMMASAWSGSSTYRKRHKD